MKESNKKVLDLIKKSEDCGSKHLSNKIEWSATIGPMLRQAIKFLEK